MARRKNVRQRSSWGIHVAVLRQARPAEQPGEHEFIAGKRYVPERGERGAIGAVALALACERVMRGIVAVQ